MRFRKPHPVKRFTAITFSDRPVLTRAREMLEREFGAVDEESEDFSFSAISSFYEREMGPNLEKIYLGFTNLADPALLAGDKALAASIEEELADRQEKRRVNIDPGHLFAGSVVLATSKGYSHRIYLRDCVWAEAELRYVRGRYEPFPWTYRDYRSEAAQSFFRRLRERYMAQLDERSLGSGSRPSIKSAGRIPSQKERRP